VCPSSGRDCQRRFDGFSAFLELLRLLQKSSEEICITDEVTEDVVKLLQHRVHPEKFECLAKFAE